MLQISKNFFESSVAIGKNLENWRHE